MQKTVWRSLPLAIILTLLVVFPAQGGEHCVWLSTDLELEARKMGYFHYDDLMTRIVSEVSDTAHAFDVSLSNTIVRFDRNSGLYGELGVNLRENVNLLFGAGYIHSNRASGLLLTVGTKYCFQDQKLINEAQFFYRILTPLVVHLSYDDNLKKFFLGLGVSFQ